MFLRDYQYYHFCAMWREGTRSNRAMTVGCLCCLATFNAVLQDAGVSEKVHRLDGHAGFAPLPRYVYAIYEYDASDARTKILIRRKIIAKSITA